MEGPWPCPGTALPTGPGPPLASPRTVLPGTTPALPPGTSPARSSLETGFLKPAENVLQVLAEKKPSERTLPTALHLSMPRPSLHRDRQVSGAHFHGKSSFRRARGPAPSWSSQTTGAEKPVSSRVLLSVPKNCNHHDVPGGSLSTQVGPSQARAGSLRSGTLCDSLWSVSSHPVVHLLRLLE